MMKHWKENHQREFEALVNEIEKMVNRGGNLKGETNANSCLRIFYGA